MGDCIHCGQPAGFLQSRHSECRDRHEGGKRELLDVIARSASEQSPNLPGAPQSSRGAHSSRIANAESSPSRAGQKPSAKPQIFVTGDGWFTYNLSQTWPSAK